MRESSDKSKLYSSAKAEREAKRAGSAGLATEAAPKMNCKCVLGSGHCYDDYAQPKYVYYMVADMAHLGWQASAN